MKADKVPLMGNDGETESGFRDFLRALSAPPPPPPLLLTQVESVFMIFTGTGRLILSRVSPRCVLMHLQLENIHPCLCRSPCAGLNREEKKLSLCWS